MANLCFFKQEFNLQFEWNFFAACHGKGAVDGIGGTIKRLVWREIKARKETVNTAFEFYNCAIKLTNSIEVKFISKNEIKEATPLLKDRWMNLKPIPRT